MICFEVLIIQVITEARDAHKANVEWEVSLCNMMKLINLLITV